MKKRIWNIRELDSDSVDKVCQALGIKNLTARMLCARGQDTPEKARSFLDISGHDFHDPFLLTDMDKATERIRLAKARNERICIYGDYDVDGVTATMALYKYLTSEGLQCSYFIPERISEGYGLNKPTILRLAQSTDLLITVDTGITAVEEVEYAASLGVEVIITDHHSCRAVLPAAVAVVNPHREDCGYPFTQLAGVGVVFKLICALAGKEKTEEICNEYSDIVAIGTIADVMPITDENRRIASIGIEKLTRTQNVGLKALMSCSGILKNGKIQRKITSSTIGFVIAPRINAAGRITNASMAVELLLSQNAERAYEIANELCDINRLRQSTESEIYSQACGQIEDNNMRGDNIIVLGSDGWHQGVIGVVASKITEHYATPSILFSFDGDIGKGSGRSIKGFNLMEALSYCEDLLIEYGGHELAAGLSIKRENLVEFRKKINEYGVGRLDRSKVMLLDIDSEIDIADITLETAQELNRLEPFGLQNPVPMLLLRDAVIASVIPVSDGKHTKLKINSAVNGAAALNAMCFNRKTESFPYMQGDTCDIVFNLDINEYNGTESVQLLVKDISLCRKELERLANGEKEYNTRREHCSSIPTVNDFREIYKALKRMTIGNIGQYDIKKLARAIPSRENPVGYCKLRIILDVLEETGLVVSAYAEDIVKIKFNPFTGKINLEASKILQQLR